MATADFVKERMSPPPPLPHPPTRHCSQSSWDRGCWCKLNSSILYRAWSMTQYILYNNLNSFIKTGPSSPGPARRPGISWPGRRVAIESSCGIRVVRLMDAERAIDWIFLLSGHVLHSVSSPQRRTMGWMFLYENVLYKKRESIWIGLSHAPVCPNNFPCIIPYTRPSLSLSLPSRPIYISCYIIHCLNLHL